MSLNRLEKNVLKAIVESTEFNVEEVVGVFVECKSFDKTIRVLEYCIKSNVSVATAIKNIKIIP